MGESVLTQKEKNERTNLVKHSQDEIRENWIESLWPIRVQRWARFETLLRKILLKGDECVSHHFVHHDAEGEYVREGCEAE
jgi:hypothetical protein